MNLPVEWVHFGDFVQGPGSNGDYKPVIRVATLRVWLSEARQESIDNGDEGIVSILGLLAQLPKEEV